MKLSESMLMATGMLGLSACIKELRSLEVNMENYIKTAIRYAEGKMSGGDFEIEPGFRA